MEYGSLQRGSTQSTVCGAWPVAHASLPGHCGPLHARKRSAPNSIREVPKSVRIQVCACVRAYVRACVRARARTHTCVYVYICRQYIYIYIYVYIYIYRTHELTLLTNLRTQPTPEVTLLNLLTNLRYPRYSRYSTCSRCSICARSLVYPWVK